MVTTRTSARAKVHTSTRPSPSNSCSPLLPTPSSLPVPIYSACTPSHTHKQTAFPSPLTSSLCPLTSLLRRLQVADPGSLWRKKMSRHHPPTPLNLFPAEPLRTSPSTPAFYSTLTPLPTPPLTLLAKCLLVTAVHLPLPQPRHPRTASSGPRPLPYRLDSGRRLCRPIYHS
jgi:hypothetical protein